MENQKNYDFTFTNEAIEAFLNCGDSEYIETDNTYGHACLCCGQYMNGTYEDGEYCEYCEEEYSN